MWYYFSMERAKKAYKDPEFLNSPAARTVRILSEYLHPERKLKKAGIRHTVVFYGSSRITREDPDPENRKYYLMAEELAYRIGLWVKENHRDHGFGICTGGGPGIMEAANRGARKAGVPSIGFNISLPQEQLPNDYIDPEFNFEFHYFFMRKFWFMYLAKAEIFFPGGYGTMDELFETLTLIQTGKKRKIPVILVGTQHWNSTVNFPRLIEKGYISREDWEIIEYADSAEEALEKLKPWLKKHLPES